VGKALQLKPPCPLLNVEVQEPGIRSRPGWLSCKIGSHLEFSAEELSFFCLVKWEPIVFDALLVAAAVEFCDRSQKQTMHHWARRFNLRVPVHDPKHWNQTNVKKTLRDALSFLTGDHWCIEFTSRKNPHPVPPQSCLEMPGGSHAIIPFSDGLDSRAVAGLVSKKLGNGNLLRVRLGSKKSEADGLSRYGQQVAAVPYRVHEGDRSFSETSARSRGFKFALISGLAAYLTKASEVIVPESGQGSLGPALAPVGQVYEDYRNHPLFTNLMESFLEALLQYRPRYTFPRLWHTKGETLREFVLECDDGVTWNRTWSCWQSARQASVNGHKRQCGICAACLLRRQSVHAADLIEDKARYVWEDLSAPSFDEGAARTFGGITNALREYAIAGTLHLDHLATLCSSETGRDAVELCAFQLSKSQNLSEDEIKAKLVRLLGQHEREWRNFMKSLGKQSFVAAWMGAEAR
jgi:hypothetical protein